MAEKLCHLLLFPDAQAFMSNKSPDFLAELFFTPLDDRPCLYERMTEGGKYYAKDKAGNRYILYVTRSEKPHFTLMSDGTVRNAEEITRPRFTIASIEQVQ